MTDTLPLLENREMPPEIARLRELAYNLWWSWQTAALALYEELAPPLWEATNHNPVKLLRRVDEARLQAAASPHYRARYRDVMAAFDAYMASQELWFPTTHPDLKDCTIVYVSPEFGLHESLPIYAGGLGILSGDHCKEASDLGVPLVGVGLLYRSDYLIQRLDESGWQHADYPSMAPEDYPIFRARTKDGASLRVTVEIGGLVMSADVWQVQVGRVPVYLLDTLVESNRPDVCQLMTRLYGGTRETRLLQEALMGIGGIRALRAMGITGNALHLNEGHTAFAGIEMMREHIANGLSPEAALEAVKAVTTFTTHTSVPAGLDRFDLALVEHTFSDYCEAAPIDRGAFLDLARQQFDWGQQFSMPKLALSLSSRRNGVSVRHGAVSRRLFHSEWPDLAVDEVPIGHVTNGIHAETWLAPGIAKLFDEYISPDWLARQDDPAIWEAVANIPDEALWEARTQLKHRLIRALNLRTRERWESGAITPTHVTRSGLMFSSHYLTIGFARRFVTYKRSTLIFHDAERLCRILTVADRPVQLIFAGKAHPEDEDGKLMMQRVCQEAIRPEMGGRVAFIENYDMWIGHLLTGGVDVWLNTPRVPREASGTSGQKAAINGVLNLSILDGWWIEGFNGKNGWGVNGEESSEAEDVQDAADAALLYDVLEKEVVPLYYDVDHRGISPGWLAFVREAIRTTMPQFGTRRMLKEYAESYYVPGMKR
jgi:starch phosphorylase